MPFDSKKSRDKRYAEYLQGLGAYGASQNITSSLSDAGLNLSSALFGANARAYGNQSLNMRMFGNQNINNAVKNGLMMSPAEMQNAILNQELSLDMYNKTQSFAAQREQMEEAGLNPALMYGLSGGINSSGGADSAEVSTGSAVAPDSPMTQLSSIVAAISDTIGTIQGIRKNNAEINNIEADTEAKKQENAARPDIQRMTLTGMDYDNASKLFGISKSYFDSLSSQFNAKMSELDSNVREELNRVEINRLRAMADYYRSTSEKNRREIKHLSFNEWIAANELKLSQTDLGRKILQTQAEIINLGHQNNLYDAQAMNAEQSAFESAERTAYIRNQNDYYQQAMFIDYVTAASTFINANTQAVGLSLSASKRGLSASGYRSKSELHKYLTGTVYQSIKDVYGDSGLYHKSNGDWFVMTPDILISPDGPLDAQWFVDHGYRWNSLANRWDKTPRTDRLPTKDTATRH